jgi:hypothetical protein
MDIHTVWPFSNSLYIVTVTGKELLEVLEAGSFCTPEGVGGFPQVAGIDYTIDTTQEYDAQKECYPGSTYYGPASIQRVTVNSINGQPFDENAEYHVLTTDFCADGGDTYYALTRAVSSLDTGVMLDDAVTDYLETGLGGVIGEEYAEAADRIHIITEENKGAADAEQAETDSSGSEAAGAGKETADSSGRQNADLAVDGHWGPTFAGCDFNQGNWNLADHNGALELTVDEAVYNAITTVGGWGGSFILNGDNVICTKVTIE